MFCRLMSLMCRWVCTYIINAKSCITIVHDNARFRTYRELILLIIVIIVEV